MYLHLFIIFINLYRIISKQALIVNIFLKFSSCFFRINLYKSMVNHNFNAYLRILKNSILFFKE
jgi:hypothetical protein